MVAMRLATFVAKPKHVGIPQVPQFVLGRSL
jgi:hypothetical protein